MERRRISKFCWFKHTIGNETRSLCFASILQERRGGEWVDIAWDDGPVLSPPPDPAVVEEDSEWGETMIARGPYTAQRKVPARSCEFSTWSIDSADHTGFARVYGKGNADRIVACLTACDGMADPVSLKLAVDTLKERPVPLLQALLSSSPDEVAQALLKVSKTREKFAYDVGVALYKEHSPPVPRPATGGPKIAVWHDDPDVYYMVSLNPKAER